MLSGFDRLRFRGTPRMLAHAKGLRGVLRALDVKLGDFGQFVQQTTEAIWQATEQLARAAGRPMRYLSSSSVDKEALACRIAKEDRIEQGLICVLRCVEPCGSYAIRFGELKSQARKCLHYYHYFIDPRFGFMHARLQSWLPLTMYICINGREWLARHMDQAGIDYVRRDNCFTALQDPRQAQELMEQMLHVDWPQTLNAIAAAVNPAHQEIFARYPQPCYWAADQSEWASDVMFKSPKDLSRVYPNLVRHGMLNLGSADVLRFLGRKVSEDGKLHPWLTEEVTSDLKQRPEGVRVKHAVGSNSIKMYDKQRQVLRVETTINYPRGMKVYRPKEGDENGEKSWRYLRKGVADLWRRAQVCQAANQRYLDALAAADHPQPLGELAEQLCRPVTWQGRRSRGLNPLAKEDASLLEAVSRGEFTINGFRNRDLRGLLYGSETNNPRESRRRSGAVTRKLRLLRAHGLIRKVPRTHRYMLSDKGRIVITALLTARAADTAKLAAAA
jgi:hypothetical protein